MKTALIATALVAASLSGQVIARGGHGGGHSHVSTPGGTFGGHHGQGSSSRTTSSNQTAPSTPGESSAAQSSSGVTKPPVQSDGG